MPPRPQHGEAGDCKDRGATQRQHRQVIAGSSRRCRHRRDTCSRWSCQSRHREIGDTAPGRRYCGRRGHAASTPIHCQPGESRCHDRRHDAKAPPGGVPRFRPNCRHHSLQGDLLHGSNPESRAWFAPATSMR